MATSATLQQCPECSSPVETGETEAVCSDCGLVVDDSPMDHGPEWRSFDGGETNQRERTMPGNRNHADRGLGSELGFAGERTKKDQRLDRWNNQAKNHTKKDRNRAYATTEIDRIGTALEVGESLIDQAKRLFRQLHEDDQLFGRDMDTIAAGCVYAVLRVHQRGLTTAEVADVARTDAGKLARRHTWICRELGLEVPPPDPKQRIRVVADDLGISEQTTKRATWLCERVPDDLAARGKPSTLAAACCYRASHRTQKDCAEAAGCTPAALRNRLEDVPGMGEL